MAELATIARPYAEALFKVVAGSPDQAAVAQQLKALAGIAADPQLRQFADNPKANATQVVELFLSVLKTPLTDSAKNLLAIVVENGRVAALPEIAGQFQALVNAESGVSDATVYSAFEIAPAQLAEAMASLEKRFGRKLKPTVVVDASLIGGIRVVVGDEVLDTSVQARLEQMRVALTA
jgi:F-type H+-transporting ATPase subunit delta